MIESKLIIIEQAARNNPAQNHLKLEAIEQTKRLLTQIDLNAEVVPMVSYIKLEALLISLKGAILTKEESELVAELLE